MKFEEVIPFLGDFGRYQKIQCLLLCLPIVVTGMHALAFTFLGATPYHRCFVPGWDDFPNKTGTLNKSLLFPWDEKTEDYSMCKMYNVNVTNGEILTTPDNKTEVLTCNRWWYDRSQYKTSVVIEWDMVCGRRPMASIAQSLYMVGMLVGAVVAGDLSDRFGRKKLMFIAQILQCIFGILLAFAPEYVTFVILRFLLGAMHSGVFLPAFVIAMEFVGAKGKVICGISFHLFFAFGFGTLSLAAYFIPYWTYTQLAITLPGFLMLCYYWERILPGSARWLLQNNRIEDSKRIIQKAADTNQVVLPKKVFEELRPDVKTHASIITMMKKPRMRRRALIICFNWFTVSLVYYGLSLSTSELPGGNDYLNLTLSGLVEIPGFLFCYFFMDRIGRRFSLCISMFGSGVACIGAAFVPADLGWLAITLSMTGKAFTGSSFTLVYNYSAEAFPTVVRNSVVGISSMAARVGGSLAPLANLLGDYLGKKFPPVSFGACSLLAGLLALFLSETVNVPMPETLDEGEMFGLPGYMAAPKSEKVPLQNGDVATDVSTEEGSESDKSFDKNESENSESDALTFNPSQNISYQSQNCV